MINGIPAITQHNNYYMTERTHVSRHPCFGDDDGDNDTFEMQNTHGQSRFTLPATLTVTRNFSHYPSRSQKTLLVSLCQHTRNMNKFELDTMVYEKLSKFHKRLAEDQRSSQIADTANPYGSTEMKICGSRGI